MIRTSPATIRRAVAAVLAAVVLPLFTPRASAQQVVDLFGGTLGTPTQLSTGGTASGTFGPGYTGNVTNGGSINNTLNEGFVANGNGSNSYFISQTGVALLGGTAVASKFFGPSLTPSTTYSFSLTTTSTAALSLLGSFNIALYNGAATGTPFVNTANGTGLGGSPVNVLGLFNVNNATATFTFTTPAAYVPANGLSVGFTGNLPINVAGGSLVFSAASINQVPEPHTVAALLLGVGGLVVLRLRRQSAAV